MPVGYPVSADWSDEGVHIGDPDDAPATAVAARGTDGDALSRSRLKVFRSGESHGFTCSDHAGHVLNPFGRQVIDPSTREFNAQGVGQVIYQPCLEPHGHPIDGALSGPEEPVQQFALELGGLRSAHAARH